MNPFISLLAALILLALAVALLLSGCASAAAPGSTYPCLDGWVCHSF